MRVAIYTRVSTGDQNPALQHEETLRYLAARGWELAGVYEDKMSGAKAARPGLNRLLADARRRTFDVVVVYKIDRFGRSVAQLVENIQMLDSLGVRFISVMQALDTDQSNPASRLLLHLLAAISEFERELIKERVQAGMRQAKKAGKSLGRPKLVFNREDVHDLRARGASLRDISKQLGLSMGAVTRTLAELKPAA